MKTRDVLMLVGCVVVTEGAGIVGGLFTTPAIPTWYASLTKSPLNPPSLIFAPVWTALFLLMGTSAFLVLRKGWSRKQIKIALAFFALQLVLNTLWSAIFFGLHNPGAAFVEIVVLWLAILATIVVFYKISRWSAYLFLPYLLWVTFAIYLNWSLWRLN